MNEIEQAINHFEGLQKRYTKTHNDKHCELVKTALDALREKLERDSEPEAESESDDGSTVDVVKELRQAIKEEAERRRKYLNIFS